MPHRRAVPRGDCRRSPAQGDVRSGRAPAGLRRAPRRADSHPAVTGARYCGPNGLRQPPPEPAGARGG
jgi:hypothetical protein